MLSTSPLVAFVPTQNSIGAHAFYADTLGLRFVSDDGFALVFDANGTMLRIVRAGDFTPFPFTLLGWQVPDIDAAVADLTTRGVQFLRYDFLDQAANGVWTAPDNAARIAWFPDPDGNTLSLSQHT
jgi:catechol 2,3-dioxygenase-like lactoylglutathione lyase family enzyme